MNEKAALIITEARKRIGEPYVFGALGEECTPKNRGRRVRDSHPTIKSKCQVLSGKATDCTGCKWQGKQMYDCRGFTYWLLKQVGISISSVGCTTQWNENVWAVKGLIRDMPDLVCCVFKQDSSGSKMSHTGMHTEGTEIIHCSVGVQYGKTTDKGWTHFAIPRGLYTEEEIKAAGLVPAPVPNLKRGSKGDLVKELQTKLISLGYEMTRYGADGSFGAETEQAVKAFQKDNGLKADGIVGEATRAALKGATPVHEKLFTVTIPNLKEAAAAELVKKYAGATMTE